MKTYFPLGIEHVRDIGDVWRLPVRKKTSPVWPALHLAPELSSDGVSFVGNDRVHCQ